ncbi:hypothetical protein [Candidatus Vidania fulgoroideorum]
MNFLKKIKINNFIIKNNFMEKFFNYINEKKNFNNSIIILKYFSKKEVIKKNVKNFFNFLNKKIIKYKKKFDLFLSGTGGGINTFNITTSLFLIMTALKIKCVKIGSVAYTSSSGSIDFINKILKIFGKKKKFKKKINIFEINDFLDIKISKTFIKLRKIIKKKTIFNIVFSMLEPFDYKLRAIGSDSCSNLKILNLISNKKTLIFNSFNIDEFSLFKPSIILNNSLKFFFFNNVFKKKYKEKKILSNSKKESVDIFLSAIENRNKTARDTLIINCSMLLYFIKKIKNVNNCFYYIKKQFKNGSIKKNLFKIINDL